MAPHAQGLADLIVSQTQTRVVFDGLEQVALRFLNPVHAKEQGSKIHRKPSGRRILIAVEFDGPLMCSDRFIELSEGLMAETNSVMTAREAGIECDGPPKSGERLRVALVVIIQPPEPVMVQSSLGSCRCQLRQFRPCPVRPTQYDIGHCKCESVRLVERRQRVGALVGNGRIQIASISKGDFAKSCQQSC